MAGSTLDGRFRLLERIATGGMGQVYRAEQLPMGRMVAVKVLPPVPEGAQGQQFAARFMREAAVTSQLKHPNTVSVFDYGVTDDGIFYIAMELLEGRTLAKTLKQQGPFPWRRAIDVTLQICRSVREAHRLGVVHRDLKPANVMLLDQDSDADVVKVLDFGLVKPFATNDADMTQSGIFLGSPTYMSPEQARGEATPRSDLYSIGVILYQLLTGVAPFESKNSIDVIVQHIQEPVPAMADKRAGLDVPPALEAIVRRCLEKDPAARYESLDPLVDALREVLDPNAPRLTRELRAAPPPLASPTPFPPAVASRASESSELTRTGALVMREPAPRRSWLVALALLVVVAVGGAGLTGAYLVGAGRSATVEPAPEPVAPPPVVVQPTAPAPPPEPVAAPPAPAATPSPPGVVRFSLDSQPSGAQVLRKGKVMGRTPFVMDVPEANDGEPTTFQVTLKLPGYQAQEVSAAGYGPEVLLLQKLAKAGEARAAPVVVKSSPPPTPAPPTPVAAAMPPPAPAPAPPVEKPAPATPSAVVDPNAARTLPEDADPPEPLESNVAPAMPDAVRGQLVDTQVVLRFIVETNGSVRGIERLKGDEPFVSAAIAAVKTWRYEPARVDGRPIAVYQVQRLQFRTKLGTEGSGTPSFAE
ncbi:MAG: TonB family protein [Myxococcaceae bacterium]|nr:TonB family protein [Myxococcaceae bacterium]